MEYGKYGITLDTAQKELDLWIEASEQVTTHQSYQLGSRTLSLANLSEIRQMIDYWNKQVTKLKEGGRRNRVRRVVMRDL